MKRVMYTSRTNLQVGASTPAGVRTYRGEIGDNAEVPDDVAGLLVSRGNAVIVTQRVSGLAGAAPAEETRTRTPRTKKR